jgi:hypothetical protein
MLITLRANKDAEKLHKWSGKPIDAFIQSFASKSTCNKCFHKFELLICVNALQVECNGIFLDYDVSWTKSRIIDEFMKLSFEKGQQIDHGRNHRSSQKVQSLKQMCLIFLNSEPKEGLVKILAEHTWRDVLTEWMTIGPFHNKMEVQDVDSMIQWFSQPALDESGKPRFHFIDACHILTCIRTKLCTTGITGLERKAWETAAMSSNNNLNISVIVDCVDKQDVSQARMIFSKQVQESMPCQYKKEIEFCELIRGWFDAEDEPGIDAKERCRLRLRLRHWLLQGYNSHFFPPPTRYVKGIPIQTYEALLTHIERKIQIYSFCNGHAYNVRSISSQQVENFFSTFRDLDSTGKEHLNQIPSQVL